MCGVDYANSWRVVEPMMFTLMALFSLLVRFQEPLPSRIPAISAAAKIATISGRITLRNSGAPVDGVPVALFSDTYTEDGAASLLMAARAQSSATGEYEVFAPSSGRYFVRTLAASASGRLYTTEQYGRSIEVTKGTDLHDVDIAVSPARMVNIRGKFIDGLGHRYPHWDWVWLVPRHVKMDLNATPFASDRKTRYINAEGYEIGDVFPGFYYLCSNRFDEIQYRAETVIPIEVRDTDIEMDIVSEASYLITGRIRFEGARFGVLNVVRVFIRAVNEKQTPLLVPGASLYPDGSFRFLPVPAGVFRLSILGIPAPFYVKSVRRGVSDVLEQGITLPSRNSSSVEVVVASDGAEISGTAPANTTVMLIPDRSGLLRPDLYKTQRVSHEGTYRIGGVAPGRYHLAAVADYSEGRQFDPAFVEGLKNRSTAIAVVAGERITIPL